MLAVILKILSVIGIVLLCLLGLVLVLAVLILVLPVKYRLKASKEKEGELNAAAIFLASEEASYVTGVILPVDGGYTCV